jgi:hypothetical protein
MQEYATIFGLIFLKYIIMPPDNSIPKNVINPFSDAFSPTWELWKEYKWESHRFKYKGVISEQVALKQLVVLSGGEEEKATKIIFQSIRREWQGLFPLHETTTPDGKSRSKKQSGASVGSKGGAQSLRSEVLAELAKRNGGGKQEGGESHLKAV